jgi:uncharacterized protein (TIGR03083 family)
MDVMRMAHDERADLADLLGSLTEAQWNAGSLCGRWRVRDVVAHMISYDDLTLTAGVRLFIRGRLRLDRINEIGVREAASLTTDQLLDRFRDHLTPAALTKGFKGAIGLVDAVIHHQDIRRPLGLSRRIPEERLRFVLDFAVRSPALPARRLARGLRLVATDLDWSSGRGPEVRGPAESVLMAVTGRPGIGEELAGEGQPLLHARASR